MINAERKPTSKCIPSNTTTENNCQYMPKARLTSHSSLDTGPASREVATGGEAGDQGQSGLKNVILVRCDPPRLYEAATGEPIPAFNAYARSIHKMRGKKRTAATNQQYTGRNAGLMDYLYECRAMGTAQIDPETLNETLESYYTFLTEGIYSDDYIIRTVAKRLGRTPITVSSALAYKAAANDFLRKHSALIRDSLARVRLLNPGIKIESPTELELMADRKRSKSEIEELRSKIMEFKYKPDNVHLIAQGGLAGGRPPPPRKRKDFPTQHILALIQNLDPLEKVVALLQCGGSLRQSETWSIKKSDINLAERTIRVEDPNYLRDPSAKELPFKGRTTAIIYMFEPFKRLFFDALADYLSIRPTTDSDFLLVSDNSDSYGIPLTEVLKPNSLNRKLNRALATSQQKGKISDPSNNNQLYTSHSLRHFYGYWARNFVYIPGRPTVGLTLAEIQVLMGHSKISSTMVYAKIDNEVMMAEIHASDQMTAIWNKTKAIDSLRADSYEALAQDLRRRMAA
ncbi:tyrosine-type recombinase/integrase [Pseudomonas syringae]|uniref:tyrosine-type recombinase/integrase n=1 Tax=Pseudomonas syringae TaxID=317 RepID=UPI003F75DC63